MALKDVNTRPRKLDDVAAEILEILDRPDPNEPLHSAVQAVTQARDAGDCPLRHEYLQAAQQHIARMDPRRHGRDIQELQGHILALQGRGGDSRIAHLTPGEVVLPAWMQEPEVMAYLANLARAHGEDPRRFQVGSPRAKVNPRTGHQEFDDSDDDGTVTVTAPRPPEWHPDTLTFDEPQISQVDMPEIQLYSPPLPNVNDPSTGLPSYGSLTFDPNGPGEWGAALSHPVAAWKARQAANQATEMTQAKYGERNPARHNGEGDAYRHGMWNYLMAQSIGPGLAQTFANAHEISSPDPEGERLMDLYNNQIGRSLPSGTDPRIAIDGALQSGYLRTRPFDDSRAGWPSSLNARRQPY